MYILGTKEEVNNNLQILRNNNKTIGLVPTMGALHQGHLELVKIAKQYSDIVVVSIFINPTQFNNQEDFEKYPKTLDKDLELLDKSGVDYLFLPETMEIYPSKPMLSIDFGHLDKILEGSFRPGHFNGVGIVVSKLLNIVKPHTAYFGQKDLQQVAIIKRLVQDLSFDVEIQVVATVREKDGVALSSRNLRLDSDSRQAARIISKALFFAKSELLDGRPWLSIRKKINQMFESEPKAKLEYFELVTSDSFYVLEGIGEEKNVSICTAAYFGDVRLIDNISIFD
ncbi:pantoate--beta-alanine ligase [Aquiflexum gelatinilyticum]|uniref:Pantothenate synthetase n=1 Tax=Aquiflexum gelatinilyticum TaxID=2961943 RepID=A0A9X2P994_9BACT|nr:pantoate--beta-alanine ligase [Aquiflexum gelatinilyticum]MCS4436801.1 pantoate--beta-alanine ligase [Aquiflexum gelatinilyticum]